MSHRDDLLGLIATYRDAGIVPDGEDLQAALDRFVDRQLDAIREEWPEGLPALLTTSCGAVMMKMVSVPPPSFLNVPLTVPVVGGPVVGANEVWMPIRRFELQAWDGRSLAEYREAP